MLIHCLRCNQNLPASSFGPNAARKSGRATYCRECMRKSIKQITYAGRYEVLSHYSNGEPCCACCGEKHIEFLAIDHIHGGGSKHCRAVNFHLATWLRKNGYPEGFRVLCHNCNFAHGHYGYCPHVSPSLVMLEIKFHRDNFKGQGGNRSQNLTPYKVRQIRLTYAQENHERM